MTDRTPTAMWSTDILARELVLSRVIDAPRSLVFSVWADAEHLTRWFCPPGFRTETLEADVRVGGRWRFRYIADDGTEYSNRVVFLRIETDRLIEFEHGSDIDDDPGRFRVLAQFDEQEDGKTVLTFRQLHPNKAQRDAGLGFGAVEIGYGTLDNLERYVESLT